jgi:Flp pilus assembly protein TadD
MKRAAAGLLFLLLAAVPVSAQEAAPAPPADDPLVRQRREATILRQSRALFEAGQYQAALGRLGDLQGDSARDAGVLNLRGAIFTKTGNYAEGRRIFEEILAADPEYFPAAFNLGELQFLQGDWAGALEVFQRLLLRDPRNELVRFQVLLCHLRLGRTDEAERIAAGLTPVGSTPGWYYAQAMLARQAGDEKRARRCLAAARSIYGAEACRLFDDSLEKVGP